MLNKDKSYLLYIFVNYVSVCSTYWLFYLFTHHSLSDLTIQIVLRFNKPNRRVYFTDDREEHLLEKMKIGRMSSISRITNVTILRIPTFQTKN